MQKGLYHEKQLELFKDGTLMVDIDGEKKGQINGLAVISSNHVMFGAPIRITAETYIGEGKIGYADKDLTGVIFKKSAETIKGYLGSKYGQKIPFVADAMISFEQMYNDLEGDSAASTHLYALLSSLSDAPIRQGIAVTGSVNQKGEVQPIGGVNEKIAGYYDVCMAKTGGKLNGEQGVMIPEKNVYDLMLRPDIIEVVKEGKFHIYSVKTIDEGIEVLTGVDAGAIDRRIEGRLKDFYSAVRPSVKELLSRA